MAIGIPTEWYNFGVNQFSLNTNNFQTKPELGGMRTFGKFYDNWDMVYGTSV
jgi:hypothetical protein